jgi:hypothetical protein
MQVIQAITVVAIPQVRFEVGTEFNDRVIIEIKDDCTEWENSIDFMYRVKDEDGGIIASIENCPVVVEYKSISVHDDLGGK